ncbi:hypothetical protein L9F63_004770 [Diploptera punctata]|uniref:PDZ domain-containing protein n=1 Tax=Diploptera punctata TaxID=6984 RepID=A0AAD7ZFW2_DIPPU|nr:hypothetical protein L9F63_004770 [Diploptera punctata]
MDQPRSIQSQRTTQGEANSASRIEEPSAGPAGSTVLFREIHKNAWLKRLPIPEKKFTGAVPKKGDRVWVVFCVHDDVEPFLEVYVDQKVAIMHKPDWTVSLNNCLHVSPTICAQEEEYEFVVTLSTEVVRFAAPSWELMMEWVDTIRSKLREMRILCPRENVYTRMPEARLPLAPTRDPNSPLPPPPAGPSTFVPGVEPVHSESSESSPSSTNNSTDSSSDETGPLPTQPTMYDSVSLQIRASTTSLYITQSEPATPHQVLNRAASFPESPVFLSPQAPSQDENITVIEVSNDQQVPQSMTPLDYQGVFNFNFVNDALPSNSTFIENSNYGDGTEGNETFYTPPVTPAITPQVTGETGSSQVEVVDSGRSYYECVFLPNMSQTPRSTDSSASETTSRTNVRSSSSGNEVEVTLSRSSSSRSNEMTPERGLRANSTSECVQRSSENAAVSNVRSGNLIPSETVVNDTHQNRRRRSSSNCETTPSSSGVSQALRIERTRVASSRTEMERRLQPAPHPYRQVQQIPQGGTVEVVGSGLLTLREQQVLQLRREMLHPGGVRLQLRRKDCTGSIALVDAFGAVWITGWKQREHPMLYNALHIGDQLLSVGGILVQNAADAQKLIRGATSLYVEFVIRRVPFGRVFAIRREVDGQSLGITQEGNTAEIRDVVPGGLAACHGLSPKAQTCDGLSLTNWVITEINGRPLNLFFKDGEVKDRLNAVGKEISILVQPFDLVKQLKKQLKALRSYKEYIVQ